MKFMKKIAASVLAAAMLMSVTACGTIGADKSWAMKNDNMTIPIGAYIYSLFASYQKAQTEVPDASLPILDQKIEEKDATQWIKDQALLYTREILVIDDKMRELNLTLTEEEKEQSTALGEQGWASLSATLEPMGVAKSSYILAFADYNQKYRKVFEAVYGEGGSQQVADAELKTYFEEHYTDFSYLIGSLYDMTTGQMLSDDDQKKLKEQFDAYAADVKDGKTTLEKAADDYKAAQKPASEVYFSTTMDLSRNTGLPVEFVAAIDAMKPGETKAVNIATAGAYVIIQKNDVAKKSDEYLKAGSSGRTEVLIQAKQTDFEKMIEDLANNYQNVQINEAAINAYGPKMFVPKATSSAPAPQTPSSSEAASSGAASSEAPSSGAASSGAASSEASSSGAASSSEPASSAE